MYLPIYVLKFQLNLMSGCGSFFPLLLYVRTVQSNFYLLYCGVHLHNLWDILEFLQKMLDLPLEISKPCRRYLHL